jgi:hypothetical protein
VLHAHFRVGGGVDAHLHRGLPHVSLRDLPALFRIQHCNIRVMNGVLCGALQLRSELARVLLVLAILRDPAACLP